MQTETHVDLSAELLIRALKDRVLFRLYDKACGRQVILYRRRVVKK